MVVASPRARHLADRLRQGTSPRRLTRHQVSLLIVLVLALGFYMWTAASSSPFVFSSHNDDVYNELTTAFLHGHTYLPIAPPAGLVHLRDPYDPAQNAPYQAAYHDLSLYHGHFYSSWGPTPALTLFLPFRLTTLRMSESFAVALFAFVGLVCAVALLHLLIRRFLPQTPNWFLTLATIGIALTNVAPFLLRRPAQYEVAVSSGYCFEMAGLLLVASAVLASPLKRGRLAFGSLCLGLAVGARPDLAAGGLVALAVAVWLIRRRGASHSILGPALAPFICCGLLVAIYNDVRFGSFTEFGVRYALAGLNQLRLVEHPAYIPPGLFSYLLIPPRLAITFPHVFLMTTAQYPFAFPHGYAGSPGTPYVEPAGGLFPTMPITLALLALPYLLWRGPRIGNRAALLIAAALSVLGLVIMVLLALAEYGTTQRYEVDYATLLLLAAFVVWAALLVHLSLRKVLRRLVTIATVTLTMIGAVIGIAVSFTGYSDALASAHPKVFSALEDITSPFAALATMVAGKAVIARVYGPLPINLPPARYGTFDEGGTSIWLGGGTETVVVDAPSAQSPSLTATARLGPYMPKNAMLLIRVSSPGRSATTVPVLGPSVRLPIKLHWGLNRIRLALASSTPTSPYQLYLRGLAVTP